MEKLITDIAAVLTSNQQNKLNRGTNQVVPQGKIRLSGNIMGWQESAKVATSDARGIPGHGTHGRMSRIPTSTLLRERKPQAAWHDTDLLHT